MKRIRKYGSKTKRKAPAGGERQLPLAFRAPNLALLASVNEAAQALGERTGLGDATALILLGAGMGAALQARGSVTVAGDDGAPVEVHPEDAHAVLASGFFALSQQIGAAAAAKRTGLHLTHRAKRNGRRKGGRK